MKYRKQLENQLWLEKRKEILERDNFQCVVCGSKNHLNVHHKRYYLNRMAWEYDNDDLVTLCQNCHSIFHANKKVNLQKNSQNDVQSDSKSNDQNVASRNRMIFFRSLIGIKEMSPAIRIVYSYLISQSMDGYDKSLINVDLCEVLYLRIGKKLNLTRNTVRTATRWLKANGYIVNGVLILKHDVLAHGYFQLKFKEGLSGELLIFYSYIKDRANSKNGILYSNRLKLSEDYNTSMMAITKLMCRLYKLNLIKKIGHNKIAVM